MRLLLLIASLILAMGSAQSRSEDGPDRTAQADILVAGLANCGAFHALMSARAQQLGKSEIANRFHIMSDAQFTLASGIAKIAGIQDTTSERAKAAVDAFMAEIGGQIANIEGLKHHLSACENFAEHVKDSVKMLFPLKRPK